MGRAQQGSAALALLRPWGEEAGRGQPLLPPLLAAADWRAVEGAVASKPGGVPWLALPLLLAPQIVAGAAAVRFCSPPPRFPCSGLPAHPQGGELGSRAWRVLRS